MPAPTDRMTSREYESLTRAVYQALLRSEGVDTVEVLHDTEVVGRSGCRHQIDVYWEFRLGGVLFRSAIECKRHASTLEIGRVRDFYGALTDIGNIQGIMVTTTGFQSGAKRFADFYGINLLELRTPTEGDWAGRFRNIEVTINACMPEIVAVSVTLDREWHAAHLKELPENYAIQVAGRDNEVGLLDSAGQLAKSWYDIQMGLPPFIYNPASDDPSRELRLHKVDTHGLFLRDPKFGLVPVAELGITYKVHVEALQIRVLADEIVKYLLRDLKTGRMHQFRADGGVINVIRPPE